MKLFFVFAFTTLIFSACDDNKGWSMEDRQKGMQQCMESLNGQFDDATSKKFCTCMIEKTMQKYKSYAEADKLGTDEDGRKWGADCAKQIQQGDQGEKKGGLFGGGGGWTNADKQKFMNTCVQNAMNTGADEETSRKHCSCTLEKIEKKYKSFNEADQTMSKEEMTSIEQQCYEERNGSNNNN